MLAIFLDFDGVLNSSERRKSRSTPTERNGLYKENIAILNRILEGLPGAHIVVTSSWRIERTLAEMKSEMMGYGILIEGRHVDVTPILPDDGRGEEIATWLSRHQEIEQYVILDDVVDDLLPGQLTHTVHIDSRYGLEAKHVDVALGLANAGEMAQAHAKGQARQPS